MRTTRRQSTVNSWERKDSIDCWWTSLARHPRYRVLQSTKS